MNFGLAFSYVFKDREWFKKIAIPALCGLIPIIGNFIVSGWALKVTKNVIEGDQEHALPKLDFGADLGRGFLAGVISLVYALPAIVFSGAGGYLFGSGTAVEDTTSIIFGVCLMIIGFALSVIIGFMSYAGLANFIAKGRLGAAFKFKEVFGLLKKSFVSWLIVALGQILALAIIAPLGMIACGIGVILTATYGTVVYTHLLGQAYNKSVVPGVIDVEII